METALFRGLRRSQSESCQRTQVALTIPAGGWNAGREVSHRPIIGARSHPRCTIKPSISEWICVDGVLAQYGSHPIIRPRRSYQGTNMSFASWVVVFVCSSVYVGFLIYLATRSAIKRAGMAIREGFQEVLDETPAQIASRYNIRTYESVALGEVNRHFDSSTQTTINGWITHELGIHGWGVGISSGSFGVSPSFLFARSAARLPGAHPRRHRRGWW